MTKVSVDKAILLAEDFEHGGELSRARAIYEQVLSKFPKNSKARSALSRLDSIHLAGEPAQKKMELIVTLHSQGKYSDSLKEVEKELENYPQNIMLLNLAGACNNSLKNYDKATQFYYKALKLSPNNHDLFFNLANNFRESGNTTKAIEHYKKILNKQPKHLGALSNISICYNIIEDYLTSISYCDQIIIIKKDFPEAYLNRAVAYKHLEQFENAINDYNTALRLNPNYKLAHKNLGILLCQLGNFELAKSHFDKIGQSDIEILLNRALIYINSDKILEAVTVLKTAEELQPDNAAVKSNLATCYYRLNLWEKAFSYSALALKLAPEDPTYTANHASMCFETNRSEDWLDYFKKAIFIEPSLSYTWDNLVFPLAIEKQNSNVEKIVNGFSTQYNYEYLEAEKAILNYVTFKGSNQQEIYFEKAKDELFSISNTVKGPFFNIKKPKNKFLHKSHEKIVALMHFGRSGTGLLHSLLDSHTQISTLPSIYLSEFFHPKSWEKLKSNGWDNIISRFESSYDVLFDATSSRPIQSLSKKLYNIGIKEGMANVGNNRNEELKIDREIFRSHLSELMKNQDEITEYDFFCLVHRAYDLTREDHNQKKLIFYHIHNPSHAAQINFSRFSQQVYWLLMVRDPIQSLESWIASQVNTNSFINVASRIKIMLYEIDNYVYRAHNSIGLRLEDVKNHPEITLPSLCDWMGIEEQKTIYKMTAMGKKWWGDPTSRNYKTDGMDPFGKEVINRKVGSILSPKDQLIFETLFYPFRETFSYVPQNKSNFKKNLQKIDPLINGLFDFEKLMLESASIERGVYERTGIYKYLRAVLRDRWNTLKRHGTYPNLINPLIC